MSGIPLSRRAVVFDMDGLMLDTEPIYRRAWQRAAEELGHPIDDATYLRFVGRRNEDCERILREISGGVFPVELFQQRWPAYWREDVVDAGIPHKPSLLATLDFVRRRGARCAVATSTHREEADWSLSRAGLAGRFDAVVCGDEVGAGKPAPDIFLVAARRLDAEPSDCVAFEDSAAGVEAAAAAGMRTILVPDLVDPPPTTRARAWRVLPSLGEAPAALIELWGAAD